MIALLMAVSLLGGQEQPQENLCVDARNCRYVGMVEVRANGETLAMRANAELPFVTPQEGLTIMLGESVVIRVEDGRPVVESTSPASEVADALLAAEAADEMLNSGPVDESVAVPIMGTQSPVQAAPPGRVRMTFFQIEGSEDTMLIIENGYAEKLSLRAHMQTPFQEGRQYTTTCDILPIHPSLEHWPEPIVFIQLSDFEFSDDDRRVACD
jgi:hypothetical protein